MTSYWFSSDRRLKFIFLIYNDDNNNNHDNDNNKDNDNDDDDDDDNDNNNIIITHCKHKLSYLPCMLLKPLKRQPYKTDTALSITLDSTLNKHNP